MGWDILGHSWAAALLQQHVAQNTYRQAYLLTGPAGVGRRTLALRFAQALNCPEPPAPGQPCGVCRTCLQTEAMKHPDLAVVQAQEVGGTLKVDQIRELQRSLALAPYAAQHRVALLLRFEEAHPSAANALLKTLEEPAARVVLLLTAESAESLLPTIVSRCEILRLRAISIPEVTAALETRWGLESQQARLLAHLSGGRPGRALGLQHNQGELAARQTWLTEQYELLNKDRTDRFAFAEQAAKDRRQVRARLETWLALWRDILLTAVQARSPLVNIDQQVHVEQLASKLGFGEAARMVTALNKALARLDKNVNVRLLLEVLLLDLPHIEGDFSA